MSDFELLKLNKNKNIHLFFFIQFLNEKINVKSVEMQLLDICNDVSELKKTKKQFYKELRLFSLEISKNWNKNDKYELLTHLNVLKKFI